MPEILQILHSNDLHDQKAPLEWLKQNRPEPDSILLDAGDAICGSTWHPFPFREAILDQMRELGYRAMAMGNR